MTLSNDIYDANFWILAADQTKKRTEKKENGEKADNSVHSLSSGTESKSGFGHGQLISGQLLG